MTQAKDSYTKYEAYRAENSVKAVDSAPQSSILSVVDNVGIVTIQGNLLDGTFGYWGSMFGIVGYGDIREAMVEAVSNQDVKSIMLVIKSGGGSVAGVAETAQLIQDVDAIKPVITYSPSMMASAALWLGLASRETYVSETAIAGSIGTISVVVSRHEQMKREGLDAVVVRSGKFKALGHPMEAISEDAVASVQEKIDYMSGIFLSYVADRRGVSTNAADVKFGQGREFVGAQAVAVGLVDGVIGYTKAFMVAKSKVQADNKPRIVGATIVGSAVSVDNADKQEGTPVKHIYTPEQLSAMAVGIDLSDVQGAASDSATTVSAYTDTAKPEQAELVELQAKLTAANDMLAETQAKLAASEAKAAELQASVDTHTTISAGMSEIVRATVRTMSLPLNLNTEAVASLNGAELVEKHKEVSELFKAKVKSGGVAAATRQTKPDESQATNAVNPMFLAAAQLNSTKGK